MSHEFAIADVLPGKLNALAKNLMGQMHITDPNEAVRRINAGEWIVVRAAEYPTLPVWRTIKIGTGIEDGVSFCCELERKDFRIGDWARDMLGQKAFTVATAEEDVDLVRLSVADLGYKEGARYDAICARAIEMGLELCPAEVGPQLRLQYPDQPPDEWFLIAMEAIRDSDGDLRVFRVEHLGAGLWLYSNCGDPALCWFPGRRFVFRARQQPLVA